MPKLKIPNRKIELLGIFLVLFALFILLSLITHSPTDYKSVVYPPNETINNKAGHIGAFISYYLFILFGLASLVIAVFIGFWGVILFLRSQISSLTIKIISLCLFLMTTLAFIGLLTPDNFTQWKLSRSMESFGGFGGYLINSFLIHYFGRAGSYTLLLFIMFSSVILATDWVAYDFALKTYRFTKVFLPRFILTVWRTIGAARAYLASRALTPQPASALPAPQSSRQAGTLTPERPMTLPEETAPVQGQASKGEVTSPLLKRRAIKQPESTGESPLPPLDILEDAVDVPQIRDDKDIKDHIATIESTLENFGVSAQMVDVERGPVVTKYEIGLGPGVSVHRVAGMADDLAIALKAPNVRIVAPIPGKSTVGIEVPNAFKGIVRLKELIVAIQSDPTRPAEVLSLFMGKDAAGTPLVKDLDEMPHLLIAGTTGAGKSVCVASVILSLLMTKSPSELKLLLIDPKMVELSVFKNIPHLISPVLTDMRRVPLVLRWLVRTMDERYELFLRAGVKKIDKYNQLSESKIKEKLSEDGEEPIDVPTRLPYIIVIIDELADLMMAASDEVETLITRLSQKSRAVGIHLVMATQRPSVDVITGLIKSNMPTRLAFKVASKVDSRTILDRNGAEKLLGQGDMLILLPATTELVRAQGTLVTEPEIKEVVNFLREQGEPVFDEELLALDNESDLEEIEKDELFDQAARIILETQRGSVTLLQRRLEIGFTRAARLIDMMARVGIVGAYKGSKAREVLMTLEEWENTPRR